MTETELKRIEYMIRVMSSHQVTNNRPGMQYGGNENQVAVSYG